MPKLTAETVKQRIAVDGKMSIAGAKTLGWDVWCGGAEGYWYYAKQEFNAELHGPFNTEYGALRKLRKHLFPELKTQSFRHPDGLPAWDHTGIMWKRR